MRAWVLGLGSLQLAMKEGEAVSNEFIRVLVTNHLDRKIAFLVVGANDDMGVDADGHCGSVKGLVPGGTSALVFPEFSKDTVLWVTAHGATVDGELLGSSEWLTRREGQLQVVIDEDTKHCPRKAMLQLQLDMGLV